MKQICVSGFEDVDVASTPIKLDSDDSTLAACLLSLGGSSLSEWSLIWILTLYFISSKSASSKLWTSYIGATSHRAHLLCHYPQQHVGIGVTTVCIT